MAGHTENRNIDRATLNLLVFNLHRGPLHLGILNLHRALLLPLVLSLPRVLLDLATLAPHPAPSTQHLWRLRYSTDTKSSRRSLDTQTAPRPLGLGDPQRTPSAFGSTVAISPRPLTFKDTRPAHSSSIPPNTQSAPTPFVLQDVGHAPRSFGSQCSQSATAVIAANHPRGAPSPRSGSKTTHVNGDQSRQKHQLCVQYRKMSLLEGSHQPTSKRIQFIIQVMTSKSYFERIHERGGRSEERQLCQFEQEDLHLVESLSTLSSPALCSSK